MTERPDRLLIDADLHLRVDGLEARITGRDSRLNVRTDHPVQLLAAARALVKATGVRAGRAGPRQLTDAGVSVAVSGTSGEVLRVGAGTGRLGIRVGTVVQERALAVTFGAAAIWLAVRRLRGNH